MVALTKQQRFILGGAIAGLVVVIIIIALINRNNQTSQPQTGIIKDNVSGELYNTNITGGVLESPSSGISTLGFNNLKKRGLTNPKQEAFETEFIKFAKEHYPDKINLIRIEKDSIQNIRGEDGVRRFTFNVYLEDTTNFQIEIETSGGSKMFFKNGDKVIKEFDVQ